MRLNSNALASVRFYEATASRALRELDQTAAKLIASRSSTGNVRLRMGVSFALRWLSLPAGLSAGDCR